MFFAILTYVKQIQSHVSVYIYSFIAICSWFVWCHRQESADGTSKRWLTSDLYNILTIRGALIVGIMVTAAQSFGALFLLQNDGEDHCEWHVLVSLFFHTNGHEYKRTLAAYTTIAHWSSVYFEYDA